MNRYKFDLKITSHYLEGQSWILRILLRSLAPRRSNTREEQRMKYVPASKARRNLTDDADSVTVDDRSVLAKTVPRYRDVGVQKRKHSTCSGLEQLTNRITPDF